MSMYKEGGKLTSCKLDKEGLKYLVSIIINEFPEEYRMDISCYFNNIRIDETNIDTFLQHKELPDRLNNLKIRISGFNNTPQQDLSESRGEWKRRNMDVRVFLSS
ncbi:hypothetical protein ACM26V_09315 [Salipaludibacillus sp. HK11]|uniref:hypothetical protein n=1 Tax=Salipaludibacillus sp. HK11 TaxID=3394320 RepID=UPI0039FD7362